MAGTEIVEPGIVVVEETGTDESLSSPWMVIVYNDPVNLMSYVTMVIQKIFGYDKAKAEGMMMDVHHKGKAIVWTGGREKAEFYVQQLQGFQLKAAMRRAGD